MIIILDEERFLLGAIIEKTKDYVDEHRHRLQFSMMSYPLLIIQEGWKWR